MKTDELKCCSQRDATLFEKKQVQHRAASSFRPSYIQNHPRRQAGPRPAQLTWPEDTGMCQAGGGGPASSAHSGPDEVSADQSSSRSQKTPFCQAEPLSLFVRCTTLSGNRDLLSQLLTAVQPHKQRLTQKKRVQVRGPSHFRTKMKVLESLGTQRTLAPCPRDTPTPGAHLEGLLGKAGREEAGPG